MSKLKSKLKSKIIKKEEEGKRTPVVFVWRRSQLQTRCSSTSDWLTPWPRSSSAASAQRCSRRVPSWTITSWWCTRQDKTTSAKAARWRSPPTTARSDTTKQSMRRSGPMSAPSATRSSSTSPTWRGTYHRFTPWGEISSVTNAEIYSPLSNAWSDTGCSFMERLTRLSLDNGCLLLYLIMEPMSYTSFSFG